MRIDQLKSRGSFGVRQYCVYEPQKKAKKSVVKPQKRNTICVAESVDIA